jgi:hypothetical protein
MNINTLEFDCFNCLQMAKYKSVSGDLYYLCADCVVSVELDGQKICAQFIKTGVN